MSTRQVNIMWVDSATSTNTELAHRPDVADGTVLAARTQTAGRGQRGNSWEAEPLKNLTFSMLVRPVGIKAAAQFVISQIVAIAIARTLQQMLGDTPEKISIKWPNDIYYGDRKICGILIENVLSGDKLHQSILGIGINVNQRRFTSPAPNPVSMVQITGQEYPLESTLQTVAGEISTMLARLEHALATDGGVGEIDRISRTYHSMLWRADGRFHRFIDKQGAEPCGLLARIDHVAPTGHLTLIDAQSHPHTFAFKEVEYVLTPPSIG